MFLLLCLLWLGFAHGAKASPWPGPSATVLVQHSLDSSVAIIPTSAPNFRAELIRRATSSKSFTGWGLDVCGWETGDYKSIYSCSQPKETCLWNSRLSIVGCGNSAVLPHYTACVSFNSTTCDDSCSADPNIIKCSGLKDECYTATFPDGYTMPACGVSKNMSKTIGLTYGGIPTPVYVPRYLDANNVLILETQFPEGYLTTSGTGPTSPTSSSNNPESSSSTEKKSNIGPIVGGVIGGLAVLLAVALGFWFLRRKRRRAENSEQSEPLQMIEAPPGPQELGGIANDRSTAWTSRVGWNCKDAV